MWWVNKKYRFNFFSSGAIVFSNVLFSNVPTFENMKCEFSISTSMRSVPVFSLLSPLCVCFFLLLQFFHHFLYRSPNHAVRLSKYNFSFFIHHQSNGTNVKSCLNFSAAADVVVVMASMNECSFLLPKMVNTSTHASENSSLIIFLKFTFN